MAKSEPTCPQCRVAMEAGHLVDHAHARLLAGKWVKGPVDWTGIEWWEGKRLKDHDVYRITSYRCPGCGMLQSFARARATAKERGGRA
jgi:hypothetical protein